MIRPGLPAPEGAIVRGLGLPAVAATPSRAAGR